MTTDDKTVRAVARAIYDSLASAAVGSPFLGGFAPVVVDDGEREGGSSFDGHFDLDAVARAAIAAMAPQWRSMDSAPRDGTWVMLYSPSTAYKPAREYVATWERLGYNDKPTWAYGPSGSEHSFRYGVYGATHWMPLPAAPLPESQT